MTNEEELQRIFDEALDAIPPPDPAMLERLLERIHGAMSLSGLASTAACGLMLEVGVDLHVTGGGFLQFARDSDGAVRCRRLAPGEVTR